MKRAVVCGFASIALFAPVRAHAAPIGIKVFNATYSVGITVRNYSDSGTITVTGDGSSPVSKTLVAAGISGPGADLNASASAGWLAVSENISQDMDFSAHASADFDLTFSTLTDGVAALGVDWTKSGEYGSGLATLFDVTTQQQVWEVSFGSDFGGCDLCPTQITGGTQSSLSYDSVVLASGLSAADVYDLHLTSSTLNPGFTTFSSVGVSGIVPVPEPSTLLLLGVGFATVVASRRRFKKRLNAPQI